MVGKPVTEEIAAAVGELAARAAKPLTTSALTPNIAARRLASRQAGRAGSSKMSERKKLVPANCAAKSAGERDQREGLPSIGQGRGRSPHRARWPTGRTLQTNRHNRSLPRRFVNWAIPYSTQFHFPIQKKCPSGRVSCGVCKTGHFERRMRRECLASSLGGQHTAWNSTDDGPEPIPPPRRSLPS